MTNLREAAQMALDALEAGVKISPNSELHEQFRARLAQPEKPQKTYTDVGEMFKDMGVHTEQEPVAWLDPDMGAAYTSEELPGDDHAAHGFEPLYTVPPQREWQGLTDEEIEALRHIIDWTAGWSYGNFARALEAKLKAKNA